MARDIDSIISMVRSRFPSVRVKQLEVLLPADDDGLWWFWLSGVIAWAQIESPDGQCPFYVEASDSDPPQLEKIDTVEGVAERIIAFLSDKQFELTDPVIQQRLAQKSELHKRLGERAV